MNTQTEPRFVFWITILHGPEIRWAGLSEKQAIALYRTTHRHPPANVTAYSWERAQ